MPRLSGHFLFIPSPFFSFFTSRFSFVVPKLLLRVFLCLLPLAGICSEPDSSAAQRPFPENYCLSILQTNPFAADRLLSAFQFDSIPVPVAGSFRFLSSPYEFQLSRILPELPLDTHLAVSELRILLGSTREQLIFLDHHQRLAKSLTGYINYHSIVSPGFTLNGLSVHRDFRLALSWQKNKFNTNVSFRYGKLRAEENGGIADSQLVAGLGKNDFEELRVLAADELRELRRYHLTWSNDFLLWQPDSSTQRLSFVLNAEWLRNATAYSGVADKDLYTNFFLDTALTRDTAGFQFLAPSAGLRYVRTSGTYRMSVEGGMKFFNGLSWKVLDKKATYNAASPFAMLRFDAPKAWLTGSVSWMLADTLNNGDFSLSAAAGWKTGSDILSGLAGEVRSATMSAPLTAMYYRSNHFQWDNDFRKEKYLSLAANLQFFNDMLSVSYRPLLLQNYVWYNENAAPRQSPESYLIHRVHLSVNKVVRKWRFSLMARYARTDAGFIRIPEWSGWLRCSFTSRFFNKALKAELGASAYGSSAVKGYAFMPATAVFHLQNETNTGGVPLLDVFVNAGIGKATLSLTYQRLSNLFMKSEYFLAPGYPGAPATLKFSVFWPLFN